MGIDFIELNIQEKYPKRIYHTDKSVPIQFVELETEDDIYRRNYLRKKAIRVEKANKILQDGITDKFKVITVYKFRKEYFNSVKGYYSEYDNTLASRPPFLEKTKINFAGRIVFDSKLSKIKLPDIDNLKLTFNQEIEYFRQKLYEGLRIPAEFITPLQVQGVNRNNRVYGNSLFSNVFASLNINTKYTMRILGGWN